MRVAVLMLTAAALLVGCAAVLAGCAALSSPPASSEAPADAVVGRIITIDDFHSYAVVDWDGGRSAINIDRRELTWYRIGDQILLDRALRPLPLSQQSGRRAGIPGTGGSVSTFQRRT